MSKPSKKKGPSLDNRREIDDRPLVMDDIKVIRTVAGLNSQDATWLLGLSPSTANSLRQGNNHQINPVPRELLARYLAHYPEYCPVPQSPDFEEVFEKIKKYMPSKFPLGRAGPFFGVTTCNGYAWDRGDNRSSTVDRLLMMLNRAMDMFGEEGLLQYLEVLEAQARSRGFDSMADVYRNKGWSHKKDGNKGKKS